MDDGASTVSATDLLDAYLDKQLTNVSPCLTPPSFAPDGLAHIALVETEDAFAESGATDVSKETEDKEKGNRSSCIWADDEDSERNYEKLAQLKSRCRLWQNNLATSERFEHESAEMLRRLERLKEKCRKVIQWHSQTPSLCSETQVRGIQKIASAIDGDGDGQNIREAEISGMTERLADIRQSVIQDLQRSKWDQYLSDDTWLAASQHPSSHSVPSTPVRTLCHEDSDETLMADDIREKYPHLFTDASYASQV